MAFDIVKASEVDASEVVQIHLKAMDNNLLMHAQFPNAEALEFFGQWLEKDMAHHIHSHDKGILVAREREGSEMLSFVKWLVVHRGLEERHTEVEAWPEFCRPEFIDPYADLTAKTRKEVMGAKSYYHVTYICTRPDQAGKGAASGLMRKVQQLAAADDMPVVLESTMSAVSFYQRLGFQSVKGLDLILPPQGSSEPIEFYEEKCMVWTPTSKDWGRL